MNTIEATKYKTKYANDEHLVIAIDGKPLDTYLSNRLQYDYLIGLVPSISWLHRDDEKNAAEKLLLPENEVCSIAPLLICPDDLDFSCTVIVAEMEFYTETVVWRRIGLDKTPTNRENVIGSEVEWFDGIGPFEFSKTSYYECINKLKNELQ